MTSTAEITAYPFVASQELTVDPRYRVLQQQGPIRVQFAYGEPCWLATRYDDCKVVYGDRRFGRRLGLEHAMPGMFDTEKIKIPTLLLNMDPPEQTRIRRLASGAFSPARIALLEAQVQGHVDDLWDDVEAAGPGADFMARFAAKLPARVMAGILGVPRDDAERFARLVDELVGVDVTDEERGRANAQLHDFVVGLIAERRRTSSDDLLSVRVDARDSGDRLSEAELESLALALWLGGVDTTHNELGSMVFTVATHPDEWQEVVEHRDLLPAALEELWRWIPSHKYGVLFPRWASEDVELSHDTVVRAGEPVYPEHTVANRDESAFPNGWELDFHRVDPQPHLTFAFGPHHCMGSHLARLEVRLALATMIERFADLDLAIPAAEIDWATGGMLRSARSLPLTWST
jgi:cytochrome P450 RapN